MIKEHDCNYMPKSFLVSVDTDYSGTWDIWDVDGVTILDDINNCPWCGKRL